MAYVRVDLNIPIYDGQPITFKSPADCSTVTGLKIYYPNGNIYFQFADSHGNNVGGKNLFAEGVLVKVILDTKNRKAFVQNADTNAYLEEKFSTLSDAGRIDTANIATNKSTGEIFNNGDNKAKGEYSHAEGSGTTASGKASHSEGIITNASGNFSHAEGNSTTAVGAYSHAEGFSTRAMSSGSHTEGANTVIPYYSKDPLAKVSETNSTDLGYCSHAEGYGTLASGAVSHAEGNGTTTSGHYSHAEGKGTTASGSISHAEGTGTTASGEASHAEGTGTISSGVSSHAEGKNTEAISECSHAEGYKTTAVSYGSHVQGRLNIPNRDSTAGTLSDIVGDAFIIGNGTEKTSGPGPGATSWHHSNAFRVTFAGETYGTSAFNSSGADYAEFFEWEDGNADAEDRVGYFVTLIGNLICKANPNDYILGIVSGQPCIIGNSDEDWLGRWEHDEFGRFIKEDVYTSVTEMKEVEVEVFDEYGNPTGETRTEMQEVETGEVIQGWKYKENPEYDSTQKYIERKDRKEWSAIGMMGVLSVRDDGTCEVNGYAKVSQGGIATKADSYVYGMTYRVIKRMSDNVVQVVFK